MKINWQPIITLVLLLGVCGSAQGSISGKKTYRLESCDCVGVYQKDMTFLSDIIGEPNIEAEATTRKQAEAAADRQCFLTFKDASPEVKESDVTSSGCKAFEKVADLDDWKAI